MFKGSVLTYDPATNGAEWISVRVTINDLSPAEDASAQELSNITIPDSPKDAPRIDHFEEHWQEHVAEAPAEEFCTGINPGKGEEVMEQAPPDGQNVSSDSSEELDSDEGIPRRCCSDSVSQAEEEGEDKELTGELAGGPTKEPAVGCPTLG